MSIELDKCVYKTKMRLYNAIGIILSLVFVLSVYGMVIFITYAIYVTLGIFWSLMIWPLVIGGCIALYVVSDYIESIVGKIATKCIEKYCLHKYRKQR